MSEYFIRHADLRKDVVLPDLSEMMDFCEKADHKEKAKEKQRKEQGEECQQ